MAYNFNGTTQYLNTVSSPLSGFPLTIACWAYPTSMPTQQVFVSIGVLGGTHRNQIGLSNLAARSASGGLINPSGSFVNSTTNGSLNNWMHVAGTFSSTSNRTVFLNGGGKATSTTDVGAQNSINSIAIGARWNTTLGLYCIGRLAEVGVWNIILTDQEIQSLAKGLTPDKIRPQNLVFYTPLVRELVDQKGGLTITNNNEATISNHTRIYK